MKRWIRDLEARADAWALSKLPPELHAEVMEDDRRLKLEWPRYLAWYVACVAAFTAGLMLLASKLDWVRAFLFANLLALCFGVFLMSAWYGYHKWTGERARRTFLVFIGSMFLGAASVLVVDIVVHQRTLADLAPRGISRMAGAVFLLGFVAVALTMSIANLRNREARQRMALLAAEAEREKLARAGAQAELKLLQAQVEPHFLFTTHANVRYLVQTGSPDALAMLDHLIHYLRTALPEIRSEASTIGREAELARAYLEIMRLRMGGALHFDIDVPDDVARAPFPPLMVMTLVENAIKHGLAPVGKGSVKVRARNGGGKVVLQVEDDGRGLSAAPGQGLGLANIRERLAALFGDRARLELAGREGGGAIATIEVPDR
jgi:sensor histidine kinase YesM